MLLINENCRVYPILLLFEIMVVSVPPEDISIARVCPEGHSGPLIAHKIKACVRVGPGIPVDSVFFVEAFETEGSQRPPSWSDRPFVSKPGFVFYDCKAPPDSVRGGHKQGKEALNYAFSFGARLMSSDMKSGAPVAPPYRASSRAASIASSTPSATSISAARSSSVGGPPDVSGTFSSVRHFFSKCLR